MASKAKTIGRTDLTQPGTAVEERERLLQSTCEQENKKLEHEHTCKNIQYWRLSGSKSSWIWSDATDWQGYLG